MAVKKSWKPRFMPRRVNVLALVEKKTSKVSTILTEI